VIEGATLLAATGRNAAAVKAIGDKPVSRVAIFWTDTGEWPLAKSHAEGQSGRIHCPIFLRS
jgi:hypothetical protein